MPASKVGGSGPEIAVILHRGGAREEKKKKRIPESSRRRNGMRFAGGIKETVHLGTNNMIAHLCSKCMH